MKFLLSLSLSSAFDCEKLEDVAKRFGTPVYFTDFSLIQEKFNQMADTFSELGRSGKSFRIFYSVKANSNPFILKFLRKLGTGLDILSEGELALSLRSGASSSDLILSGTMISDSLFKEAARIGFRVNLDSLESISRSARNGLRHAGIRVNPLVEAGHHAKVKTAISTTKFGIAPDEFAMAKEEFAKHGISLDGLHYHIGSGVTTADPFIEALSQVLNSIDDLDKLQYLDIGGGYAESKEKRHFDFAPLVGSLKKNSNSIPDQIFVETGRYLVASSTVLLTRVTEVKRTNGRTFVGVDAGFNDMMRTMLYGAEHEIFICGGGTDAFVADLVGPICETGDVFRRNISINAKEGSLVALRDVGAYGYSLSSNYLVRPRPAEVGVYKEKLFLMRRRETIDDLLSEVDWTGVDSVL